MAEYVFRGTTLGYEGSASSVSMPYTCTSVNPLKATLFALLCKLEHYPDPLVYIAKTEKLTGIKTISHRGRSAVIEEEVGWQIQPVAFYKVCEGYITLDEMKAVLRGMALYPSGSVTLNNLSERCEEIDPLDVNVIENIVAKLQKIYKK